MSLTPLNPHIATRVGTGARRRHRAARLAAALVTLMTVVAVSLATASRPADAAPSTWSVNTSAAIGGTPSNQLNSVSCVSATFCMAVGSYESGGTVTPGVVEQWNGHRWSAIYSISPGTDNQFNGVSCVSTTFCVAVGSYDVDTDLLTLVATWNGSTWSETTSPNANRFNLLSAVSCSSPTTCMAVGTTGSNGASDLVETWNGSAWSIVPALPATNNFDYSSLYGVSCSGSACMVVGFYTEGGSTFPQVESWDGNGWQFDEVADTAGADYLDSVSCTSSTACQAVGYIVVNGSLYPLIESYGGGTYQGRPNWTSNSGPGNGSAGTVLNGVSCTDSADCVAVGDDQTGSAAQTVIESYDAGNWSDSGGPSGGTTAGYLDSVSCTNLDSCQAVGYDDTSSGLPQILVEQGAFSPEIASSPASASIMLGMSDVDTAVVTGDTSGSPTGTVSFYECGPTATAAPCTSIGAPLGGPVALAAGPGDTATASSPSFTPTSTGYWCFAETYSGDATFSPGRDTTTDGCVDVSTAPSSTTTIPTNPSIFVGQTESGLGTVQGNVLGGSPSGKVTFYACGPTAASTPCTSTSNPLGGSVALTSGPNDSAIASLPTFTPTSAGYWCLAGYYSGDGNYSPSSDDSRQQTVGSGIDECFDVTVAPSSTITTPAATTITLGQTDAALGTVTGNSVGGSPSGTVAFYECGPSATPSQCFSTADQVGGPASLTPGAGDTATATSPSFTPTATGTWCLAGYYSGDGNYGPSSDDSHLPTIGGGLDECFDVTPAASFSTTAPTNPTLTLGSADTELTTIGGNAAGGSPTGTVTFYACGPTATAMPCTSTSDPVGGPVVLTPGTGHTASVTSPSFTPSSVGYWCVSGHYSGDANYSASLDATTDGCIDVTGPVTIATSSLPNATEKVPYSFTLTARGGHSPYRWSTVGKLPKGLKLNASTGLLSGTPKVSGSFTITFKVTDSTRPHHEQATGILLLDITT